MVREILFRGKRKGNGEWVYGDLIRYESGEMAILNRFSKYGCEATEICRRIKVIPETVGEFTGLTDKNGKKIFEGDIVKDIDGRFYRICLFEYEWFADLSTSIGISMKNLKPCEVIGNIFENPELLEDKQ